VVALAFAVARRVFAALRHLGAGFCVADLLRRVGSRSICCCCWPRSDSTSGSGSGWRTRCAAAASARSASRSISPLLCYFKYTNFLFDSLTTLTGTPAAIRQRHPAARHFLLHLQQIAYLVDVMRGARVERDIVSYHAVTCRSSRI